MGQNIEKIEGMVIERLIQVAAEALLTGVEERVVRKFVNLNDEQMERAKELYEQMKNKEIH